METLNNMYCALRHDMPAPGLGEKVLVNLNLKRARLQLFEALGGVVARLAF